MQNPGAWGEGIALTFGKTGNPGDATGVALSGLGVKPAEDLKSRNKQMQDLFKEMFGDSDEDVAKEKYLNLAMIGFAIASGASGNALTNISQGMMQGVSKMLEDQKDRKGRDEKLKYAAFNMASDAQNRADDRATALIDAATTRKNSFTDALNLYSLKKDRDDESKTFLDTDKGKGMQNLFESLNTASGSPAAALTQMSTAYSPEDIKRWQSASGILGTPAALSEEQKANQALFNKYNKP
jgi:gas vesicle protein